MSNIKGRIKDFFKNFWLVLKRPEMAILPGQLAFFFVLSVVPIITLIGYAASYLNLSLSFISDFIEKAFGGDIASLVVPIVSNNDIGVRFFVTLGIGYFIASNGADSMIVTSNTIYGITNKNYIARRLKALIMTFIIVILFIFVLVVPAFGDKIIALIKYVNMNPDITNNIVNIFNILKSPISWLIIFMFIKILYTMAPDRKIPSSFVNYGALFTTVFWILSTALYSFYISNIARYDVLYGGLANIVILMLWVYLLAYIFVIGMALNFHEEETILEKTREIELQSVAKEIMTDSLIKVVDVKKPIKNKNKASKIK